MNGRLSLSVIVEAARIAREAQGGMRCAECGSKGVLNDPSAMVVFGKSAPWFVHGTCSPQEKRP